MRQPGTGIDAVRFRGYLTDRLCRMFGVKMAKDCVFENPKGARWTVATLLFLLGNGLAQAQGKPSFDCAKATQPIEHLIYADLNLSALDVKMNAAFMQRLDAVGGQTPEALTEQRKWLRERIETCHIGNSLPTEPELAQMQKCVGSLYQARLEQLSAPIPKTNDNICKPVADRIRGFAPPNGVEDIWAFPWKWVGGSASHILL